MGLFNWFKSNAFASMDELEQMDLVDGLGVTGIKKDIQSIKERLADLENSSSWQDNIITAEEAAGRLRQIENEALPRELNKAFATIDEALNDEQDSLMLFEYTKEYEDQRCTTYNMVRAYHIKRLAEILRKYGYRVDIYDLKDEYGLRIKIYLRDNDKLESSKIDPDKKYILPMEKFEGNVLYGRYKWYAFKNEEGFWNSFAHISNEQAMGNYAVQGKDILNAPDWVKAIKPIEVKE